MAHSPRQRADAVVEFALLAPLLVLILFGILELGRVVDAWIVVHNAAREGARAGIVSNPLPTAAGAAQNAATSYLTTSTTNRADIDQIVVTTPVVSPESVTVTAELRVRIYSPLMQMVIPSPLPVRASVTMPR